MTTQETLSGTEPAAGTKKGLDTFVFPDPPLNQDEKMDNFRHLSITGAAYLVSRYLAKRLGDAAAGTVIDSEVYLCESRPKTMKGVLYPDLLVAFDADPDLCERRNAYVISEQGKPPDMVLEIASPSTARRDTGVKRVGYAELRVPEYWRFDKTGEHHKTRLAGERLTAEGVYEPISIEEVADGVVQGYSAVLGLCLRWDHEVLVFVDPADNLPIPTMQDAEDQAATERARREAAEIHAEAEQIRADAAEDRADAAENRAGNADNRVAAERARREAAEARMRELEEQLRQMRNPG